MTATDTRVRLSDAWDHALEKRVLHRLVADLGITLPEARGETRLPRSEEERDLFYHHWARVAALDFYIFESCAAGIGLAPDPEAELFLTRQIGDDGHHAELFRERIVAVSGRDPIDDIRRYAQGQWDIMGRISAESWLGFLAFEIHYELYVVPTLFLSGHLDARISDPALIELGAERFLPDEAVHRLNVVKWWRRHLRELSQSDRRAAAGELRALDDAVQRRREDDLRVGWDLSLRAAQSKDLGFEVLHNAWRCEVQEFLYAS